MAESIVQALESFTTDVDGIPIMVTQGSLYYASDPITKGRESLFGDLTVLSTTGLRHRHLTSATGNAVQTDVETATQEPGQRRRLTPRRQDAAPKVDAPAPAVSSEV